MARLLTMNPNRRLPIPPRLIGLYQQRRKQPVDDLPESLAPGSVWPWDLVWTELNKIEPPAIPINPATLVTLIPNHEPPTIRINKVPAAVDLPAVPNANLQVELDIPSREADKTYIDLTNDDIELYPTPPSPQYHPVADLTAVSLARRAAKRDHRNRLRNLAIDNNNDSAASSQSYSSDGSQETDDEADPSQRQYKRIKLEGDQTQQPHDNRMLPG
jgi:hypothetical protein